MERAQLNDENLQKKMHCHGDGEKEHNCCHKAQQFAENEATQTQQHQCCHKGGCGQNRETSDAEKEENFQRVLIECAKEHLSKKPDPKIIQEKWDRRFMDMAKMVSSWSTCVRENRQVGSVIVKDKRVIATGYNGAPSKILSCSEKGYCLRDKLNIESGTRAEVCFSTHAEQNALIQAAKMGISVDGSTIYVTHRPCVICTKLLINAGIKRIVYGYNYPDEFSVTLLTQAGIELVYMPYDENDSKLISDSLKNG